MLQLLQMVCTAAPSRPAPWQRRGSAARIYIYAARILVSSPARCSNNGFFYSWQGARHCATDLDIDNDLARVYKCFRSCRLVPSGQECSSIKPLPRLCHDCISRWPISLSHLYSGLLSCPCWSDGTSSDHSKPLFFAPCRLFVLMRTANLSKKSQRYHQQTLTHNKS